MKNQIITIFVSVLVGFALVKLTEKDEPNALDSYIFKQEQKRIDSVVEKYNQIEIKLQEYENQLNIKYEKIDSASKPVFRDMLNDFSARTNRHHMPKH